MKLIAKFVQASLLLSLDIIIVEPIYDSVQTSSLLSTMKVDDIDTHHDDNGETIIPSLSSSLNSREGGDSLVSSLIPNSNKHEPLTIEENRNTMEIGSDKKGIEWKSLGDMIVGDKQSKAHSSFMAPKSMALSHDGRTIAIGPKSHVRVYSYNNYEESWNQIGHDIDGQHDIGKLAKTIAMSENGTRIVVGSRRQDWMTYRANAVVQVFENIDNLWTQIGNAIKIGNVTVNESNVCQYQFCFDNLQLEMSLDGTIIVVGAHFEDFKKRERLGSVTAYKEESGSWHQIGSTLKGSTYKDDFGSSLSLTGDSTDNLTIAVGIIDLENPYSGEGKVQIFKYMNNNESGEKDWKKIGSDLFCNKKGYYCTSFGGLVSLSGNNEYLSVTGHHMSMVQVFQFQPSGSNTSWSQVGQDIPVSQTWEKSTSISHDGKRLIVGDARQHEFGCTDQGRAQIFQLNEIHGKWEQLGEDLADLWCCVIEGYSERFGYNTAMSRDGLIVAAGAFTTESTTNIGYVRVFKMAEYPANSTVLSGTSTLNMGLLIGGLGAITILLL